MAWDRMASRLNLIEGNYSLILNYKNIELFKNNNTYFEISLDGDLIHKELFNLIPKIKRLIFLVKIQYVSIFKLKHIMMVGLFLS